MGIVCMSATIAFGDDTKAGGDMRIGINRVFFTCKWDNVSYLFKGVDS